MGPHIALAPLLQRALQAHWPGCLGVRRTGHPGRAAGCASQQPPARG